MDIEEQLEEYGLGLDEMYDLPRHDLRLVSAVESYVSRYPNQQSYDLVNVDSGRYLIHTDVNGYETLITDKSEKWVNV